MQRKKAGWFHAFLKLPVKSALYGYLKCSGLADSVTFADAGLNTGTVIIRNSDWSRMLVEDMATYGKYPVDWSKEATLRAAVPTYDMGMYEQNVLIYRITSDPRMLEKVSGCLSPLLLCAVFRRWTSSVRFSSS